MLKWFLRKENRQQNTFYFVFFTFCARICRMFEEPFKTVMLAKNGQDTEIDVCWLYL